MLKIIGGYGGIFLGTFLEGPVVGLLAGSLVRMGKLELIWVYLVHVLGDLIADSMYYWLGFYSKMIKKVDKREKESKLAMTLEKHADRLIIGGKLTHILGLPILLGLGRNKYSWKKFLLLDLIATAIKSAGLIGLGYYLADGWAKAGSVAGKLGWMSGGVMVIIGLYLGAKKIRLYEKLENPDCE